MDRNKILAEVLLECLINKLDQPLRMAVMAAVVKSLEDSRFCQAPATVTGRGHPEWTHGLGGLIKHTVFACWLGSMLADSLDLSAEERQSALAALILHDVWKYPTKKNLVTNHAEVARDWWVTLSNHLIDQDTVTMVAGAIHAHMGKWDIGPQPQNPVEHLVHMSDYLASRPVWLLRNWINAQEWVLCSTTTF